MPAGRSAGQPKTIAVSELIDRLELAYSSLELTPEQYARLCLTVLPEEYSDSGRPLSPLKALPNSSRRIQELAERVAARQQAFRPDDPDVPDELGILLERIGPGNPSGALAPKSRHNKDTDEDDLVSYDYRLLRGQDRADLPECSDRRIREGDLWRKKDNGEALVALFRQVLPKIPGGGNTFPTRLREARTRRKWSLGQLARRTGLHRAFLSRLERGLRMPTYDVLRRLARVFVVDIADMILTTWPD